MKKLSEKERLQMRDASTKYMEVWRKARDTAFEALSPELKEFAKDCRRIGTYKAESGLYKELVNGLASGKYKCPSDFLREKAGGLFEGWIYPRRREAVCCIADRMGEYAFAEGDMYARSFRSDDCANAAQRVMRLLYVFMEYDHFDADIADLLTDNIPEDMLAHKYYTRIFGCLSEELAYEIDRGNETVISFVREALDGDNASFELGTVISGVVRAHNRELYELLGKLLLAARLQEGLRQAICERADKGTAEAFKVILGVIRDNGLMRYSSVKRAVGTWIGLISSAEEGRASDLERISEKSVELICDCIDSFEKREEYLKTEDSMKIYIALWAEGFYNVRNMTERIRQISREGSHHQLLTAGYAVQNICEKSFEQEISAYVLAEHYSEPDIAAMYMPCFMKDSSIQMRIALGEVPSYFSGKREYDYSKRAYAELSTYFKDKAEAERYYDILMELYRSIKGKSADFSPCVFPWHSASIEKGGLVLRLAYIASALRDNDRIDEIAALLGDIGSDHGYYARCTAIELLLTQPETDRQRELLAREVCGKQEYARETAFKIISFTEISAESYRILEDALRYKNAQMRSNIIRLLCAQRDGQLFETVSRLISDKKEEKRTAALDIIICICEDGKRELLAEKLRPLAAVGENTTTKEKILIERINPPSKAEEKPPVYDTNASYTPKVSAEFAEKAEITFKKYFYDGNDFDETLQKLSTLITEHENDEFTEAYSGDTVTLGAHRMFVTRYEGENGTCIPFRELWENFYNKEIGSPVRILRMLMALLSEGDYDEFSRECVRMLSPIIGNGLAMGGEYIRRTILWEICIHLFSKFGDTAEAGFAAAYAVMKLAELENLSITAPNYAGQKTEYSLCACYQVKVLINFMQKTGRENFSDIFAVKVMLSEKMKQGSQHIYGRKFYFNNHMVSGILAVYTSDYIRAAFYGVISEDYMYKCFFEKEESGYYRNERLLGEALNFVSNIYSGIREYNAPVSGRGFVSRSRSGIQEVKAFTGKDSPEEYDDEDRKLLEFTERIYDTLIGEVVETELKRGDTPTKYSDVIGKLNRIYGADKLAAILSALGGETLDRASWYSKKTKKETLSHLLAVCIPLPDDNAETLRRAVMGTDITEKRIVEASLYSPEWLGIAEEYLGWEGFRSACYYFVAHMNEDFDERRKALIAKYTPLTAEELNAGAFDIDWFRSAYDTLGEKRFDMVYNAAKYISDGSKHSRARKYADAVLGRLDPEKTRETIADKRNKDLLMAYALIPVKNDDDICGRYLYLQQFLKESKKFGSQRSASEKAAVLTAMQNLAINAGYSDVTRLTLRMETKLIDDSRELFEDKALDDVTVRLAVDENGKAEIVCQKGGKPLKSVPAKLKKNEYIVRLTEVKKKLTEQYRRTRLMLEQAMEDGTEFTVSELWELGRNPVASPLIRDIVFIAGDSSGYICAEGLRDFCGRVSTLSPEYRASVAHPYALYKEGHWSDYQRELFDRKICQPFKQVFRELYVKTAEEAEMTRSLRYAGNQIQPSRAAACLKTRRWVADVENGLQKVYYKENIIAVIYAMADWFSPADIEAPTLEWVCFYSRKTGEELKIKDIPDVIFSEVMRDVDMAVSVAHAGGVDPETSHSTVEMRSALLSLTLSLFGISNVLIQGSHAHITGQLADYTLHLGSGVIHRKGGAMINILPVHSSHRGKLFLPFADDDPKTAEIITKALYLADDGKIKDPSVLSQLRG